MYQAIARVPPHVSHSAVKLFFLGGGGGVVISEFSIIQIKVIYIINMLSASEQLLHAILCYN